MPISFKIEEIQGQRVISINGEIFDWGLDEESINQANEQIDIKSVHSDIREHFLISLSEILGFKPKMKQVNKALKTGFLE